MTGLTNLNLISFVAIGIPYSNNLGPYLAGLIEGDGSIYVPESQPGIKNTSTSAVTITFVSKDYPLALYLTKVIGGKVYSTKGNYYVLRINKIDELYKLVLLLNGYFRTPKIEALHRLINWLNDKNKFSPIPLLGLDQSNIGDNGWLAGFIEADGGFQISIRLNKDKTLHKLDTDFTFNIQQDYSRISEFGNSYLPIMEKIALLFL